MNCIGILENANNDFIIRGKFIRSQHCEININ